MRALQASIPRITGASAVLVAPVRRKAVRNAISSAFGIAKTHIRKAGVATGIGGDIGWHTFRRSYRSWLDETGAPLTVQKELMRHASIQTTMNIYGKAMTDRKRQAHSKVVEIVLNHSKSEQTVDLQNAVSAIRS